jgi:hypothetical protein
MPEQRKHLYQRFRLARPLSTLVATVGAAFALSSLAFQFWSTNRIITLRARYAAEGVRGLQGVKISWKGKQLVARGEARDESAFVELSHKLAPIVGADFVVNETRVSSLERRPEPGRLIGIVTIPVNTLYDDSPDSLQIVSAILRLPQYEILNITANATLSSVVLERYRFGPSDLPHSYALLAQRIGELNRLSNLDQINVGPLKAPILPPRALVRPVSAEHSHGGFAFYSGLAAITGLSGTLVNPSAVDRAIVPPTIPNASEAISMLSIPVTGSTLDQTKRALPNLSVQITSAKMTVRLADAPSTRGNLHKPLNDKELAALRVALVKKPRRNATVFILDDGWPDVTAYTQSLDELQRISDLARDHYGLGHVDLKNTAFTPISVPNPHSVSIRDSLTEFTDADTQRIVKVVYVPLSRDQSSTAVLQELLRMHYIARTAKNSGMIDEKIVKAADEYASAALSNVQASFNDQKIDTDEAIIQAVWSLADLVSQQSRGRDIFFINESWTVISGTFEDAHPGVSAGIAVVAAGNVPGKVVNSDVEGVDFARQCASTRSVLAVLNVVPGTGIACNSSIVNQDVIDTTFVAAYDGEVYSGPSEAKCLNGDVGQCVCGTSFSAPRVAWLLALSEAERSADLDYTLWNALLETKLQKLRTNSSTIWTGIYLPVAELLK